MEFELHLDEKNIIHKEIDATDYESKDFLPRIRAITRALSSEALSVGGAMGVTASAKALLSSSGIISITVLSRLAMMFLPIRRVTIL